MHSQFEPIDQALRNSGVSIAELAELTEITRCTLMCWKSGKHEADHLRLRIVLGYAALLERAVAAGKLPLSMTPMQQRSRTERIKAIRSILTEVRKAG